MSTMSEHILPELKGWTKSILQSRQVAKHVGTMLTHHVSFMIATQNGHPGLAAALLQALRWRLDKAISATDRCQVLSGYIHRDILLLRSIHLTSLSLGLVFGYNCGVRLLPWYLCVTLLCCSVCCLQHVWLVLSLPLPQPIVVCDVLLSCHRTGILGNHLHSFLALNDVRFAFNTPVSKHIIISYILTTGFTTCASHAGNPVESILGRGMVLKRQARLQANNGPVCWVC